MQMPNQHLDYLIGPSFPGVNRLFALSFEDNVVTTGHWIFSSENGNKSLQSYDRWKKLF